MSRGIGATNVTQTEAASVHVVILVKLEFDTPVYVHSGIGTITYDGDDYVGVGGYGSVSQAAESEKISPSKLTLTLSGIDTTLISEAQDTGNYRDVITIFEGYRQDDGTLYDDPWIVWKGLFEYSSIQIDENEASVAIVCNHDLVILEEKHGSRFTDEDQQQRYSGDNFFKFITDQAGLRLRWGGGPGTGGGPFPPSTPPPGYHLR